MLCILAIACSDIKDKSQYSEVYKGELVCSDNKGQSDKIASVKVLVYGADYLLYGGDDEICVEEYDKSGRVVSKYHCDINGELRYKDIYSYKQDNVLDSMVRYNSDGELSMREYHVSESEEIVNIIFYDKDGEEFYKQVVEFEGENIKSYIVYRNGDLESTNVNQYHGDVKETIHFDNTGKETGRTREKMMDNQIVKCEYVSNDCSYSLQYDNGLPIKSVNCYVINGITTCESKYSSSDPVYYSYEYEFDAKNNWTRCTIYEGEEKLVHHEIERKIEYY